MISGYLQYIVCMGEIRDAYGMLDRALQRMK